MMYLKPNYSEKKREKEKKPKAITVLKKKRRGVRRGMIMITDSIGFFLLTPSLTGSGYWPVYCVPVVGNIFY